MKEIFKIILVVITFVIIAAGLAFAFSKSVSWVLERFPKPLTQEEFLEPAQETPSEEISEEDSELASLQNLCYSTGGYWWSTQSDADVQQVKEGRQGTHGYWYKNGNHYICGCLGYGFWDAEVGCRRVQCPEPYFPYGYGCLGFFGGQLASDGTNFTDVEPKTVEFIACDTTESGYNCDTRDYGLATIHLKQEGVYAVGSNTFSITRWQRYSGPRNNFGYKTFIGCGTKSCYERSKNTKYIFDDGSEFRPRITYLVPYEKKDNWQVPENNGEYEKKEVLGYDEQGVEIHGDYHQVFLYPGTIMATNFNIFKFYLPSGEYEISLTPEIVKVKPGSETVLTTNMVKKYYSKGEMDTSLFVLGAEKEPSDKNYYDYLLNLFEEIGIKMKKTVGYFSTAPTWMLEKLDPFGLFNPAYYQRGSPGYEHITLTRDYIKNRDDENGTVCHEMAHALFDRAEEKLEVLGGCFEEGLAETLCIKMGYANEKIFESCPADCANLTQGNTGSLPAMYCMADPSQEPVTTHTAGLCVFCQLWKEGIVTDEFLKNLFNPSCKVKTYSGKYVCGRTFDKSSNDVDALNFVLSKAANKDLADLLKKIGLNVTGYKNMCQ